MLPNVAGAHILDVPAAADKEYSYFIPDSLREQVRIGGFVHAPFGRGNREKIGVVTSIRYEPALSENLKPLVGCKTDGLCALDAEAMRLCEYLREQTFCSYGEAIRTLLPKGALGKLRGLYRIRQPEMGEEKRESYNQKTIAVYDFLRAKKCCSTELLRRQFGEDVEKALLFLSEQGFLAVDYEMKESRGRYMDTVRLRSDADVGELLQKGKIRSEKQRLVLALLREEGGCMELPVLKERLGAVSAQVGALEKKGLLTVERQLLDRMPPYTPLRQPELPFSEEQTAAVETLTALYRSGKPQAALLHGVTGSGKTRVMLEVIDRVLSDGRQVILLVPEISLTPQTMGIFAARYGERVALIHSGLSEGERLDAWYRMKNGKADLCVGTRSAVFAPFSRLGMIVMDEEQEHTYKSDASPRYHCRDVARYRCGTAKEGALLLLASATPSLESYYKAKSGIYTLVELKNRYGEAKLPQAVIDDMRGQTPAGGAVAPLGELLVGEIAAALRRKEQSILFVGRRGYHHALSCTLCGTPVCCPNCSVSLTYHSRRKKAPDSVLPTAGEGYLLCHYCGYRAALPKGCGNCGGALQFLGYGTQLVERELSLRFPEARILRMDADTTGNKYAYEQMLSEFREEKYDILLGTQMVTKGHDFPNVTLVGVILADMGLYSEDYRAGEDCFSLLTQVIGRAGRSEKAGRAVIQTFSPDHPTLRLAAEQDFGQFYENEICLRKALLFPPFCDLAVLTLQCEDEGVLETAALRLKEQMEKCLREEYPDITVQAFGPMEPAVYKLQGKCRLRFLLKCRVNKRTREYLRETVSRFLEKAGGKVSITPDINPTGA